VRILYGGPHAGERHELIGFEGGKPPIWIVWKHKNGPWSSYWRPSLDWEPLTLGPMFEEAKQT
jgi:hypothetical protein